jgi:hypothetical protein
MSYTMNLHDLLGDYIMTLHYKPKIGDMIRNDKTMRFYKVEVINEGQRICYAGISKGV